MQNTEIVMYGTTWCPDCTRAKRVFADRGINYLWINIDDEPDKAELVMRLNNGKRIVPTIIFPNGSMFAEPSNPELEKKLKALELNT